MPLEHSLSKEAFGHNIKAELKAGKPLKQAEAIAFSVKRATSNGKGRREARQRALDNAKR